MANLTRYLQKIFAKNSNQIGVFGTGINKQTSTNVETLQSADYEAGWSAAIVTNKNYPIWQERDGVDYGFSYQLAYLFQKGIPEWLSTETYYTNDYCRVGNEIYYSLQDSNIGKNPSTETTYWQRYINQGSFVAKTGDTMSGALALQYGKPFINLNSTDVTYNTAPATTDLYNGLSFNDANGNYMGYVGIIRYTDNSTANALSVRGADGVEDSIRIQRWANGKSNTYAPASDVVNSIVTTTGITKDASGYVKFGNGLILQWGRISPDSASVTFPTAFTSTNYHAFGDIEADVELGESIICYVRTKATTYMTVATGSSSSAFRNYWLAGTAWFAIGY